MPFALLLSLALTQVDGGAPASLDVQLPDGPTPAPWHEQNASLGVGTRTPGTLSIDSTLPWYQRLTIGGFARIGAYFTLPFRDQALVGSNGGFRMAAARLNLDFHPVDDFVVFASVELAAPIADPNDPTVGRRVIDLRDAYLQYHFCSGFNVRVGQQRPGYYAEMLLSDGAIPFVERSIIANGLAAPEGYPRNALAPDRQLGINLYSNRLGSEWVGFKYALGVFNGNGQNQLFNDNNSVQPVARVELDVKQLVTLGLNGYYNKRTDGARPTQLSTDQLAFGADLAVQVSGFSALGAFLGKRSMYSYPGLLPDLSLGAMGQLRYFHDGTGLEVAGRFAWLEPSQVQADDQLMEIAAMIGWRPFKLPFRVVLQYTHREEERLASYPNDNVDMMIHAVW